MTVLAPTRRPQSRTQNFRVFLELNLRELGFLAEQVVAMSEGRINHPSIVVVVVGRSLHRVNVEAAGYYVR